jgi:tyrosine-protein kinase Etk/Wzc
MAGKRTVLIDCDLRKPRIHKIFGQSKTPGFTDYVFDKAMYNEIVRKSDLQDLYYVTSGTIPPNPAEILGSNQFADFLEKLKSDFDIIIVDSPPVLAVTDSEILSRIVDVTILVTAANITETEVMKKSVELLEHDRGSFIGILLNNFIYKNGYGNYYKNYYYYQNSKTTKRKIYLKQKQI